MDNIAIIDIETTLSNKLMSIGLVISNSSTMQILSKYYYIIIPNYEEGGLYSDSLFIKNIDYQLLTKFEVINVIHNILDLSEVSNIFAYNASFEINNLPEFSKYNWYDIMKIAAYKQFNTKIPNTIECFKTGKIKKGYGLESILKMLLNNNYIETHNALIDAEDAFKVMQLLNIPIDIYYKNAFIDTSNIKEKIINKLLYKKDNEALIKNTLKNNINNENIIINTNGINSLNIINSKYDDYSYKFLSKECISIRERQPFNKNNLYEILNMSYTDYVNHLLDKYGSVPFNYFLDEKCTIKPKQNSKTYMGLEIHHIDENIEILLCLGSKNYEYQKANRLVYADKIEHLILHIKIINDYGTSYWNLGISDIIKSINELYSYWIITNKLPTDWHKNMLDKIISKYNTFILLLRIIYDLSKDTSVLFHNFTHNKIIEDFINLKEYKDELYSTNIDL